jgi:hypothetical protein
VGVGFPVPACDIVRTGLRIYKWWTIFMRLGIQAS